MTRSDTPKNYEEFLLFMFNRPVAEKSGDEWYWHDDEPEDFTEGEAHTVALYAHFFEHCGQDLKPYSDDQVALGLNYLTNNSMSNLMYSLLSDAVPLPDRLRAIRAMKHLYRDCFAVRCSETLGHLSESSGHLNGVCYMLWDVSPLSPGLADNNRNYAEVLIEVLESALHLNHLAVAESALHGLGHLKFYRPTEVEAAINRFLDGNLWHHPRREALDDYARVARTGMIQ